jgi:hypothetical protein
MATVWKKYGSGIVKAYKKHIKSVKTKSQATGLPTFKRLATLADGTPKSGLLRTKRQAKPTQRALKGQVKA